MSLKFFSNHLQDILNLYEHATEAFPSTSAASTPTNAAAPQNQASTSSQSEPTSPVVSFTRSLPASIARHIPRGRKSATTSATTPPDSESLLNGFAGGGTSPRVDEALKSPASPSSVENSVFTLSQGTPLDFASEGLSLNGELRIQPDSDDESNKQCAAKPPKEKKRVKFPDGDDIVSGYCDAYHAPFHRVNSDLSPLNLDEIVAAYRQACRKHRVEPNPNVERQIVTTFHTSPTERQPCLSLKGIRMNQAHMESLEEVFRRVQFDLLDFEYAYLDDDSTIGLTEMIDFYESAKRLNLSFNQKIGVRGWNAIFRMLRRSAALMDLDLRYTSLNHRTIPLFARTLRCQHSLTVLRLENCAISSQSLLILVCAFKANRTLREVYLGENNLSPTDGAHLYQLLTGSQSIELLDLRHNNLQDAGLGHICDALRDQDSQKYARLHTLVLWNNRFTPAGMMHIARALSTTTKLETLNLGCNHVSSAGIDHIKHALAQNRTLQRLGLQACRLNCQAAIALAEVLAENVSLTRLDLRDNQDIRSAGLLALHLAMKMNTTMTSLNLDASCCVTNQKTKELSDQFKRYYDEVMQICEDNEKKADERVRAVAEAAAEQGGEAVAEVTGQLVLNTGVEAGSQAELIGAVSPAEEATSLNQVIDANDQSPYSVLNDGANSPTKGARGNRTLSMTCDDPVKDTYANRIHEMPPVVNTPAESAKGVPKLGSLSDDEEGGEQQGKTATPPTDQMTALRTSDQALLPDSSAATSTTVDSQSCTNSSATPQQQKQQLQRRESVCSVDEADTVAELTHISPATTTAARRQRSESEPGNKDQEPAKSVGQFKKKVHKKRKNRFAVKKVESVEMPMHRPTALAFSSTSNGSTRPTYSYVMTGTSITDHPLSRTGRLPSAADRHPSLSDPLDPDDIEKTVYRVVQDLVNFCCYEVGDESVVNTPSVPRARRESYRSSVSELSPDEADTLISTATSRLHSVSLVGHIPEHVTPPKSDDYSPPFALHSAQPECSRRPTDESDLDTEMAVRKCVRDLVKSTIVLERDTLRRCVVKKRHKLTVGMFNSPK